MIQGFSGTLIDDSHEAFNTQRFGWNGMIDRRPRLIASCSSAHDVSSAVRHASDHKLQAVARCGGHSVSGASIPDNGIMVDLSGIKQIEVDPESRIAHVGGGALLGEVDAATQEHALAVTAGVEPATGVGGLTLGGGIGFMARKTGLTIDSMIGAQVVLADGNIVEASETEHPDLFWALRGGGGEFGIVTRFDFKLHEIGPNVVVAQAFYPVESAPGVMKSVRELMHSASEDLGLVTALMTIPPADVFPAKWHGQQCIALVACHFGDDSRAREELQPMLELGDSILGFVDSMPYVQFQQTFAGAAPKGGRYYWKSIFVDDLSDDLANVLVDGIKSIPGEYTQIFMESLGGAVSRVAVEDTAFSNRAARYNLGVSAGWANAAKDDEIIAATRAIYSRLASFSDGTAYLNYLDRDEAARTSAAFGPNYQRLKGIKSDYDPHNRFPGLLAKS